jgi:hypothetical protein
MDTAADYMPLGDIVYNTQADGWQCCGNPRNCEVPLTNATYPGAPPNQLIAVQYLPTAGIPTYVTGVPTSAAPTASSSASSSANGTPSSAVFVTSISKSQSSSTTSLDQTIGVNTLGQTIGLNTLGQTVTVSAPLQSASSEGSGSSPQLQKSDGLSTGVKVAIGLGAALGVALLLLLILFFVIPRRRRSSAKGSGDGPMAYRSQHHHHMSASTLGPPLEQHVGGVSYSEELETPTEQRTSPITDAKHGEKYPPLVPANANDNQISLVELPENVQYFELAAPTFKEKTAKVRKSIASIASRKDQKKSRKQTAHNILDPSKLPRLPQQT